MFLLLAFSSTNQAITKITHTRTIHLHFLITAFLPLTIIENGANFATLANRHTLLVTYKNNLYTISNSEETILQMQTQYEHEIYANDRSQKLPANGNPKYLGPTERVSVRMLILLHTSALMYNTNIIITKTTVVIIVSKVKTNQGAHLNDIKRGLQKKKKKRNQLTTN